MLLWLVRFVDIGMRPIPHIFTYRPESKLLKTDGAQRTMFRMVYEYPVLSQNVPLGTRTHYTPEQNYYTPEQE